MKPLALKYSLAGSRCPDSSARWLPVPYDFPLTPYSKTGRCSSSRARSHPRLLILSNLDELWYWNKAYPNEIDTKGRMKLEYRGEVVLVDTQAESD